VKGVVLGVAIGISLQLVAHAVAAETSPPRVIKMTAKKFEYSPAEVHIKKGEHVVLELTSLDRKHGFKLPEPLSPIERRVLASPHQRPPGSGG
jgi:cytochrome c oxidase subunit 2